MQPITLTASRSQLIPLQVDHGEALFEAGADPRIWQYMPTVVRTLADIRWWVESALREQELATALPFAIVDLEGANAAATLIHHGSMDHCESSYQTLAQWMESNGYRSNGFAREFYLDYDPENPENGVTELQIPVEKV